MRPTKPEMKTMCGKMRDALRCIGQNTYEVRPSLVLHSLCLHYPNAFIGLSSSVCRFPLAIRLRCVLGKVLETLRVGREAIVMSLSPLDAFRCTLMMRLCTALPTRQLAIGGDGQRVRLSVRTEERQVLPAHGLYS